MCITLHISDNTCSLMLYCSESLAKCLILGKVIIFLVILKSFFHYLLASGIAFMKSNAITLCGNCFSLWKSLGFLFIPSIQTFHNDMPWCGYFTFLYFIIMLFYYFLQNIFSTLPSNSFIDFKKQFYFYIFKRFFPVHSPFLLHHVALQIQQSLINESFFLLHCLSLSPWFIFPIYLYLPLIFKSIFHIREFPFCIS